MAEDNARPALHLSYGPHIHGVTTTNSIMWTVNLALLPALTWAVLIFGWQVLGITVSAIIGAVVGEELVTRLRNRRSTLTDGSAVCTGLLLSFTLPPALPLWMPFIGSVMAIVLAKGLFGGLGFNLFNPALVGRALMMATFPVAMTTAWVAPKLGQLAAVDAVATATPLALLKEKGLDAALQALQSAPNETGYLLRLVLGLRPGSIGEVSVLFIMLGAAFLLWKRIIRIWIPLGVFMGVGAIAMFSDAPILHLFTGGIWLAAFFMATDYVTSPSMPMAQFLFGLGIGVLTGVIRLWGGYPEGLNYAILLMNILTPALNEWFRPKRVSLRSTP